MMEMQRVEAKLADAKHIKPRSHELMPIWQTFVNINILRII